MKYKIKVTNRFKRDIKLAKKQGRSVDKLFEIVQKIANGETLELKYRDHALSGNFKNARECHIEPDFLLIYEKIENVLVLSLIRARSHSDLFM